VPLGKEPSGCGNAKAGIIKTKILTSFGKDFLFAVQK
jgi:hypothetical protein